MSTPVAAPSGSSHTASIGCRWRGLVQIAFWSSKNRRGVPVSVIFSGSAGFDGGGAALVLFCGSGASGSELERFVEAFAAGCKGASWAGQKRPVESRKNAVRQRLVQIFGRVRGIGKG